MNSLAKSADPELQRDSNGTAGPASTLTRRKILGRASVSAAAVATSVGDPSSLANRRIESGREAQAEAPEQASEQDAAHSRQDPAVRVLLQTTTTERYVA